VLEPEMVDELEALLDETPAVFTVPRSPHDSDNSDPLSDSSPARSDEEARP
jgi:hypothetical protein